MRKDEAGAGVPKKLRNKLGHPVVMTYKAGKNGVGLDYPVGLIVGYWGNFGIVVRRFGLHKTTEYHSDFWKLAPKRLVMALGL